MLDTLQILGFSAQTIVLLEDHPLAALIQESNTLCSIKFRENIFGAGLFLFEANCLKSVWRKIPEKLYTSINYLFPSSYRQAGCSDTWK
jgi:hypothetical protein